MLQVSLAILILIFMYFNINATMLAIVIFLYAMSLLKMPRVPLDNPIIFSKLEKYVRIIFAISLICYSGFLLI